jgi:hypothetical protein
MDHLQIMSSLIVCTRKFARPHHLPADSPLSFFYNLKGTVSNKMVKKRKVIDSSLKSAGVTTLLFFN